MWDSLRTKHSVVRVFLSTWMHILDITCNVCAIMSIRSNFVLVPVKQSKVATRTLKSGPTSQKSHLLGVPVEQRIVYEMDKNAQGGVKVVPPSGSPG